ncbi:protein unzipped isoform X2 [Harpegnathos saltator]|uniref:Protein unzipped n=2 Tax=Harpegnathos saltator TaxID=610380 RepID=E2BD97_HARSA|nr:protein unzipped isoform X2 [Harpegnathos saltator]XP_025155540.1 protein unzipped isoform X2 [Harpegnathos saltator]EFN86325.1 Protein unzipped [Harpegnathos saltator]
MLWQKNYLALGLLGVLLLSVTADNSVHILSKYGQQQVTSTTLKWLPVVHYNPSESKEIVIGGFEIAPDGGEDETFANQAEKPEMKRRPLYVCRAMHSSSVWLAGTQKDKEKRCTVTLHGSVQSYDKYELLENVDGAARITWVRWTKFFQPLLGAVYVDKKMLVARYEADNSDKRDTTKSRYTHYIGTLNSNDNFGSIIYANENREEKFTKSGELLVETEPIRYELSAVKLDWPKKRSIKREPRVLAETTITNTGTEAAQMAEACTYSYNYSVYWGRRHAILNGLNTSITLVNGSTLSNVTWGTRREEIRMDVHNVIVFLEPGTGVNVTLRANYTDMEVPYRATLISHYEDSATTSRVISGTRQEETMFDIMPEFGPVYFLNNYSLVPTTMPPPTTEPTTTTITTMMTTTTKQPQEMSKTTHRHRQMNDESDNDENLIIPPKKTDMSTGMQNDDGGPLSLKNKVEITHGGACGALKSSLLTLAPVLLLILHRIT